MELVWNDFSSLICTQTFIFDSVQDVKSNAESIVHNLFVDLHGNTMVII